MAKISYSPIAFKGRSSGLSRLALSLWLFTAIAGAEVRITQVVVDGEPQATTASSTVEGREVKPLKVSTSARTVQFQFCEQDAQGRPTARLRYKLEGYDEGWQDLPVKLRAIIYFRDPANHVIASSEFYLSGETPGWRGSLEKSDFAPRRELATAPERAASVRISFLSHGGNEAMGLLGMDAVRVLVEPAKGGTAKSFDLNVRQGTELSHPLGSPVNWVREGSRAELAQLLTRPTPKPHPILAINDDDPFFFGNWATSTSMPVGPGDRVTLEWQTAHSIGGSGSGLASYSGLKPGRYWLRVAAAKANGELTGQEVSLPLLIVAPIYLRWEFWLALAVLAGGITLWLRQILVQRRMRRQLAELERQQALERERARIARDLHDDIGAGLTEIAMQSDWVRRDLAQGPTADTQRRIARVCESAVELTRSVDEMVWAVTPVNDTLERFVNYLVQSTEQFLEAAGLRVRFNIPQELPPVVLPGKVRHLLFLAVREALNNAVKHARADLVRVELRLEANGLRLAIEDNGRGFVPEQAKANGTHEGLSSMQRRLEELGGQFHLSSQPGSGTRVEFSVTLAVEKPFAMTGK